MVRQMNAVYKNRRYAPSSETPLRIEKNKKARITGYV